MKTNEFDTTLVETQPQRTTKLFQASQNRIHRRADRLFANLMVMQWLAGIAAALWITPNTWIGDTSQTHVHVWAAIFLGGAITALPVFLAWKQPGRVLTRHVIAVGQMLTSALLIHLTGGRIETHFHVFGSLAFFAFYRDWRVLATATIVVAVDHAVRGIFWPQSAFGVLTSSPWRWMEHAGWVVFEDIFLFISIRQSLRDMVEVAAHQAGLEAAKAGVERQVKERTAELAAAHQGLQASEHRIRMMLEASPECVKLVAADGTLLEMNPTGLRLIEADSSENAIGHNVINLIVPEHQGMFRTLNEAIFKGQSRVAEFEIIGLKGTRRWMRTSACPLRDMEGKIIAQLAVTSDISERKRADQQMAELNKQVIDASRQAGMAEVATSVLHNVGNVLNSVNVSTTLLGERLRKSKAPSLARVNTLLKQHSDHLGEFLANDPQGRQVPGFLEILAGQLATEHDFMIGEVQALSRNVGHIKDIVAMQQSFAKIGGLMEAVKVSDLIEDTLRMNASSLTRHEIELVKDIEQGLPSVELDKHKALQIMVNLVRNAKQACDETGRTDKRITIRAFRENDTIRISVADNGVGIPAENLDRIFNHGFTTKKDGHGFGLHGSANAAKEMGGSLTVASEGAGLGAAFILEFPTNSARPSVDPVAPGSQLLSA